jgi:hypothetical protein
MSGSAAALSSASNRGSAGGCGFRPDRRRRIGFGSWAVLLLVIGDRRLDCVLGQRDVTEYPDQSGHCLPVRLAECPLDVVHPSPPSMAGLQASGTEKTEK